MLAQIDCKLSRGDTKPPAFMNKGPRFNQGRSGGEVRWTFPKSDWTDIEITFIDYDRIVEFVGVSVSPGVITNPRVVEPRSAKE
jgi:hypothetical protein